MRKINIGYTNKSFKKDNFFYQEKVKNKFNHRSKYDNIQDFDFVPKLYENKKNFSVWEWIDGRSLDNPTFDELKELVVILKKIHTSNIKLAKSNIKKRISYYRKIMKQKLIRIEVIEKLRQKIDQITKMMDKSKPIHGDLYRTNIIKRNGDQKLFVVDWEYSHMGDIHYELAYIIEAYEFDQEKETFFLEQYQDYDSKILNDHKILVNYITVLWLYSQDTMPFSPNKLISRLVKQEQLNDI